jgi:hypothetical protein
MKKGFIEYGEMYGYPKCCIAEFVECVLFPDKLAARKRRKLHGTGYVPCSGCNEKQEIELIKAINANRDAKLKPFKSRE